MAELHSFHVFFRQRCIHRYLCSEAAVTAVMHCTSFEHVRDKASPAACADGPAESDAAHPSTSEDLGEYNAHYEKLLIGFLSGLTSFCKTIHVTNELRRPDGISVSYFNVCATPNFKIHYLETLTGYKLVCITSPDVVSLELTMNAIYTDLIANMVLSNPLYNIGSTICCPEFDDLVAKTLLANL